MSTIRLSTDAHAGTEKALVGRGGAMSGTDVRLAMGNDRWDGQRAQAFKAWEFGAGGGRA